MHFFPRTKWGKVRFLIASAVLFSLFLYTWLMPLYGYLSYAPQEGDILFQSVYPTPLVRAIEGCTESPYSHCGVVVGKNGSWFVFEAGETVRKTPLFRWLRQGRGGRFDAYRLKKKYRKDIPGFTAALEKYEGRPYDIRYRMDDDHIYCSELVYKAYKDATGTGLGECKRLGELKWQAFEDTIRSIEGRLPLDRVMITPRHLSEAEQIEMIFSN